MLINSDKDGYDEKSNFDYCIIGAGPAGITTALNLSKKNSVFLAEAGSKEHTEKSQENYDANITFNYFTNDLNPYRLRYFGGTSNHWGGMCYNYNKDEILIPFDEYSKFKSSAENILEIKLKENFSINNKIKVTHYARSPVNFGNKYYKIIKDQKNIFAHLCCNLVSLKFEGNKIVSAKFSNYENKEKIIFAKKFIFSMGSFENIRMLKLFFDKSYNPWNKLLGKNWTDHFNSFYLGNFILFNHETIFKNNNISVGLALDDQILKKYDLPKANVHFNADNNFKCNLPNFILKNFKRLYKIPNCSGHINSNWDNHTNGKHNSLELSKNFKCRFGIPKLNVYNINDGFDSNKIREYLVQLGRLFAELDIGRIRISEKIEHNNWSYHQMMGSPMGSSPYNGVVDENLKVFGIDNLYTVGGNVFNKQLSGKNPTFMITILALRLSNYLNNLQT